MNVQIHNYLNYKNFMVDWIDSQPHKGRGQKSRLAEQLGCRPSYLSQILRGEMELSAEQSVKAARFIGLNQRESRFFRLLTDHSRAGSEDLRAQLQAEIDEARALLSDHGHRVGATRKLEEDAQSKYYSSWQYGAVHMMLTVPWLRTKEAIAKALRLDESRIASILRYLVQCGLAKEQDGGEFDVGDARLHAKPRSDEANRHHSNLRTLALASLQNPDERGLYFSSIISLSKADRLRVRKRLIEVMEQIQIDIEPSPAEEVLVFNIDLFSL